MPPTNPEPIPHNPDPLPQYPREEGDITVLGPQIFASLDGDVICWKGNNYVRQSSILMPAGPSLLYTSSDDNSGTQSTLRVDRNVVDDPRERALCRALLHHALALLDASEPARRAPVGLESGRR